MRHDDDSDPILRRRARRAAQQRRNMLIGGGVVAALVLLGCFGLTGLLVVGKGRLPAAIAGPSPSREGRDWTHRELFDYLRQRGIVAEMAPDGGGTAIFITKDANMTNVKFLLSERYYARGAAEVFKCETATEARDQAGLDNQGRRLAWGRFYFQGDKELIAAIAHALK